jgi:hypothetical protein
VIEKLKQWWDKVMEWVTPAPAPVPVPIPVGGRR